LKFEPKSICVPRGKKVTLWSMCSFKGKSAVLTKSNACIKEGGPFKLIGVKRALKLNRNPHSKGFVQKFTIEDNE